jgi:hypothetical protein
MHYSGIKFTLVFCDLHIISLDKISIFDTLREKRVKICHMQLKARKLLAIYVYPHHMFEGKSHACLQRY